MVACGQCIGCRIERSRQWAVRLVHQGQLSPLSAFLTLTYADEHLPPHGSLVKKHFSDFMKRLRQRICRQHHDRNWRISFFHVGEYGELDERPHYHALIFNYDFPDKVEVKKNTSGDPLYRSAMLDEVWGFGHAWIGALTFQSAAYVARYCVKKISGPEASGYYSRVDPVTGEVVQVVPEYATMSLRPAIAEPWFRKFRDDVFPRDYAVMRGKKMRVPRYYDQLLKREDPAAHGGIKAARLVAASRHYADQTPARLAVRETVARARATLKRRSPC